MSLSLTKWNLEVALVSESLSKPTESIRHSSFISPNRWMNFHLFTVDCCWLHQCFISNDWKPRRYCCLQWVHAAAAKVTKLVFAFKLYSYKFIISVILYVWMNGYLCICNKKCILFSILTRDILNKWSWTPTIYVMYSIGANVKHLNLKKKCSEVVVLSSPLW